MKTGIVRIDVSYTSSYATGGMLAYSMLLTGLMKGRQLEDFNDAEYAVSGCIDAPDRLPSGCCSQWNAFGMDIMYRAGCWY